MRFRGFAKRVPEDTLVQFMYLPVLRARIALRGNDPRKAIAELQAARPYDLAMPGTAFFGFYGGLYLVYVRGEAYLAAGQGAEAAVEFQKILDHRFIALPIHRRASPLATGPSLRVDGDKAKAKTAYQDFLTLWRDADPAVPVLAQAKSKRIRQAVNAPPPVLSVSSAAHVFNNFHAPSPIP